MRNLYGPNGEIQFDRDRAAAHQYFLPARQPEHGLPPQLPGDARVPGREQLLRGGRPGEVRRGLSSGSRRSWARSRTTPRTRSRPSTGSGTSSASRTASAWSPWPWTTTGSS